MIESRYNTVKPLPELESAKALQNGQEYTKEELQKVCQEFEAIFTQQLLKVMWKTIPENGALPKSTARKMWEDMYIEELAKDVSKGRGLGLADSLYRQLSAQLAYQETTKTPRK